MCYNYYDFSKEKLTKSYEEVMITEALLSGYNVIVDSTNLNPKIISKWKQLAKILNVILEFKEIVIPYKEAVKRDKLRLLPIGEDQIRMFYRKYYPDLLQSELDEL